AWGGGPASMRGSPMSGGPTGRGRAGRIALAIPKRSPIRPSARAAGARSASIRCRRDRPMCRATRAVTATAASGRRGSPRWRPRRGGASGRAARGVLPAAGARGAALAVAVTAPTGMIGLQLRVDDVDAAGPPAHAVAVVEAWAQTLAAPATRRAYRVAVLSIL